jgi:biopolymer transport protein ExbD
MRVKKPEEEPFEILLIPMIDCMLVIIIFFLVATTLKSHERELPVDLPKASAALQIVQQPDIFVIGVDRQGVTYLSDNGFMVPVDTERLIQRVREVAVANPNRQVRVDADRDTRFADVIRVIDLCQFNGLKNVGLHTSAPLGATGN